SVPVEDPNRSGAVAELWMVEEGDQATVRRDPNVADPRPGLVEHVADRILQPAAAAHVVRDRQLLSVRRPVGVLHVLEDLARGASREGSSSERPDRLKPDREMTVERERELAGGGDRENIRPGKREGARDMPLRDGREDLDGPAVDRRAV